MDTLALDKYVEDLRRRRNEAAARNRMDVAIALEVWARIVEESFGRRLGSN
jgi:hypothetical protein